MMVFLFVICRGLFVYLVLLLLLLTFFVILSFAMFTVDCFPRQLCWHVMVYCDNNKINIWTLFLCLSWKRVVDRNSPSIVANSIKILMERNFHKNKNKNFDSFWNSYILLPSSSSWLYLLKWMLSVLSCIREHWRSTAVVCSVQRERGERERERSCRCCLSWQWSNALQ